ncbi:MAG: hypothetical protein LBR65_04550 [Culturomica sp.]|jgi:hypothetical protein|nr:hypothetical protein [Culturomica sp.]
MERITDQKFQKLSFKEMENLNGGKNIVLHHPCVGGMSDSEPVSETLVGYSWINRVFTKHTKYDVKYQEYDEAYNCE